ncbi:SOS response-associated peptidase [Chitinophaga sp. GCM10012297]|uniref:Abasic site processing protein n=1 Tax=Chitinophaga chungangae TaxID=2821488 RepID=A0ABS3YBA1_9BACT|nr:SOS response-associated peptidase [Chitinophaga chungangae]MBO9151939.1 SOS response-associated peptidase [Chitinophaga chungangae]
MCGRYELNDNRTFKIIEKNLLPDDFNVSVYKHFNIAPTMTVPVLTAPKQMELMYWWLIPPYEKEFKAGKYSMFNKKSEELDKPYWQNLLKAQRCVLPLSGFYEWKKIDSKTKIPYRIHPDDAAFFWGACLYDNWIDRNTGEVKRSFTILTTAANEFMAEVHDRMPVFLQPERAFDWLNPEFPNPKDLLAPFPAEQMCKYRVSKDVGNSRNNYPELILPAE